MVKNFIVLLTALLFPLLVPADANSADSSHLFTIGDFYAQIIHYHPVARQAAFLDEKARQEIRVARRMLDPQFSSKFYGKRSFSGNDWLILFQKFEFN